MIQLFYCVTSTILWYFLLAFTYSSIIEISNRVQMRNDKNLYFFVNGISVAIMIFNFSYSKRGKSDVKQQNAWKFHPPFDEIQTIIKNVLWINEAKWVENVWKSQGKFQWAIVFVFHKNVHHKSPDFLVFPKRARERGWKIPLILHFCEFINFYFDRVVSCILLVKSGRLWASHEP